MANPQVKLSVCPINSCLSLNLLDITGAQTISASGGGTENPYGWGGTNKNISDVRAATVDIVISDGTIIPTINVYPTLPNLFNIPFVLLNTDAGFAADYKFADGATDITYTVTFSDTTTSIYNATVFLYCGVACCVSKKLAKATKAYGTKKFEELREEYIDANFWLDLLIFSSCCPDPNVDECTELLTQLQLLCENCNCGC